MSNSRVWGMSSAARCWTAIVTSPASLLHRHGERLADGFAGSVPLRRIRRPRLLDERRVVMVELQTGDEAKPGQGLTGLNDAAQRLVDPIAQLRWQAWVECQELHVPERQGKLVPQEMLESTGSQQHLGQPRLVCLCAL